MISTFILAAIGIAAIFAFQHWFENFDRSDNAEERESLSVKWHAAQWVALTAMSAMPIVAFKLWFLIIPLIGAMIVWWWVFDGYKGLKYGRGVFYAGNGKGSSMEKAISWLAVKKLNTSFQWFYLAVKVWTTMLYFAFCIWYY